MNDFQLWFSTGLTHILDLRGYDHILYVMALCALYTFREWKRLLLLVTAFTVGHSATLACSVLRLVSVPQVWVEILIPITIIITCIVNIANRHKPLTRFNLTYFLALFFGFIHGLGFSYLLRSMLGREDSVWLPLLSFNLGLEAGQIVIVMAMLIISVFLYRYTRVSKPMYATALSSVALLVAGYLLFNHLNEL